MIPEKKISQLSDMEQFSVSPARKRINYAIEAMSQAVIGYEVPPSDYVPKNELTQQTVQLLRQLSQLVDETPPLQTKQRFGNPSYREWLSKVHEVLDTGNEELDYYLQNSFGSSQRIDYGTGHELNFIAFWDGLVRVHGSPTISGPDLLHVFSEYFKLCRKFIITYSLEPAGSHGVWGLDDHFHLPFILGASELCQLGPTERPQPKDLLDPKMVGLYKDKNMYFAAIDFILSVKKGPFFEHSPILYDVSGVKSMAKIRSGMIKMYNGEVLNKLQVVQHFYFGTLFPYDNKV